MGFLIDGNVFIAVAAVVGVILIFYFLSKMPLREVNKPKANDELLDNINSKVELLTLINLDLGKKLHDLTCEDCNAEETEETDIKESDNETK